VALMGMSRQHIVAAMLYVTGAVCWYEAVTNIVSITDSYMTWMGSMGGHLAGSMGSGASMRNPSAIFATGLKAAKKIGDVSSKLSFLEGDGGLIILISIFTAVLLMVCMLLGAIAVVTVIQAYVDVTVGVALMPFAVEPGTRFLAMPGIGKILSAGFSLGTVSTIVGAGLGLMQGAAKAIPREGEAALRYAVNMTCASFVIAVIAGLALFMSRAGVAKLTSGSSMIGR
jgi:type IV secretory pathway TrbL component